MADRIDEITEAFETVWIERGGGHNGLGRTQVRPFVHRALHRSERRALFAHRRPTHRRALATTLLGDDFNYMGSDGNYYVGDTAGTPTAGTPAGKPQHLKIALLRSGHARQRRAARDPAATATEMTMPHPQEQIRHSPDQYEGHDVPAVAVKNAAATCCALTTH